MMIYVCSPLRGEPPHSVAKLNRNKRRAAEYSKIVAKAGHIPITPHLYFTQFLNDANADERKLGMEMGAELLRKCDEVRVFGKTTSEGMKSEIELASSAGIPVIYNQ